jgi:hypothetical protein
LNLETSEGSEAHSEGAESPGESAPDEVSPATRLRLWNELQSNAATSEPVLAGEIVVRTSQFCQKAIAPEVASTCREILFA